MTSETGERSVPKRICGVACPLDNAHLGRSDQLSELRCPGEDGILRGVVISVLGDESSRGRNCLDGRVA